MAQSLSFCSACDSSNPVTVKCLDCDFFICNSCKIVHQRIPATKDHTVLEIKELDDISKLQQPRRIFEKCETHKLDITLYCSSCHVFVCSDCIAEIHRRHELDKIESVFQEKNNEVKGLLQEAGERRKSFLHQKESIKEVTKEFKTHTHQLLYETLDKEEIFLKNEIERQFRKFRSEVTAKTDSVLADVNKWERQMDSAISDVDDVISSLRAFSEKQDTTTFQAIKTKDVRRTFAPQKLSFTLPIFVYINANIKNFGKIQTEEHLYVISTETTLPITTKEGHVSTETRINESKMDKWQYDVCGICSKPAITQCLLHSCNHAFCKTCITDHFKKMRSCPACFKSYNMIPKKHSAILTMTVESDESFYYVKFQRRADPFPFIEIMKKINGFPTNYKVKLPLTNTGDVVVKLLAVANERNLLFKTDIYQCDLSDNELSEIIHLKRYAEDLPTPSSESLESFICHLESMGVTEVDIEY